MGEYGGKKEKVQENKTLSTNIHTYPCCNFVGVS